MERNVIPIAVGAGIGGAQTFILKAYVDEQIGPIIPGIGGFGYPSSVAGWGAGGIATILGLLGKTGKGPIRGEIADFALSYGIPALIGGVLSGYLSGETTPPASARAPVMRLASTSVTPGRLVSTTPSVIRT